MQCRLQFGRKSKLCEHYPRKNEVCRALWCQRNGRECETKFLPAAEGTPCGKNKWCRKGLCVAQESVNPPKPVDGGWSPFGNWTNCSRTCGGGLMHQERFCNSPPPSNGGEDCRGESRRYQICGTKECESDSPEFQKNQCETFNKRRVKGKHYKWQPYDKDLGALSRCRIYCVPDKEDLYLILSTKLQDGTSCSGNFSNVCIEGECRAVGCDGIVESSIMPDQCGVCNGDNSTCKTIKGTYDAFNLSRGYHEVIRIPANSRHLNISEENESPAYLAVRSIQNDYFLNGNWVIAWPGRYTAAGTTFSYRRWPGHPENIISKGPIMEEIVVEVLVQDSQPSVINYEFVVASDKGHWKLNNSSCSTTCGNGTLTVSAVCEDYAGEAIDEANCPLQKPLLKTHICNLGPCPYRWFTSEWSPCLPNSCEQYREVYCENNGKKVAIHKCHQEQRPEDQRTCQKDECLYQWVTGTWSRCRGKCSSEFQTRSVTCKSHMNGMVVASFAHCKALSRPAHLRKCRSEDCSRNVPITDSKWVSGPWSECNVKCGQGEKIRNVTCLQIINGNRRHSNNCNHDLKPLSRQKCFQKPCDVQEVPVCRDHYDWCSTSTNMKLCKLPFYTKNCCKSCKKIS